MTTQDTPAPILVAVDGTNLVHRAHHAYSRTDRRSHTGAPTWALWGLARLLAGAVEDVTARFRAPAGLTVAFDGPRDDCRRRAADPGYKATRREPDAELAAKLTAAPQLLRDCGFDVAIADGWEADDGVASAAKVATDAGWRCVIVTSDRDALAHCSTSTRVLRPVNGGGWDAFGTREVAAKYSLPPQHGCYAEFSALRGDPSDELPGVAGVGEKTAATLLCALAEVQRTVEDVLEGDDVARTVLKERTLRLLDAGADNYRRNRRLMDANLELAVDLEAAARPVDPSAVAEACAYQGVPDAEEYLLAVAGQRLAQLAGAEF